MVGAVRSLPNLKGTVHMGKTRRQMMDMEFENVLKNSSAHYYSHPFTKGNFINLLIYFKDRNFKEVFNPLN